MATAKTSKAAYNVQKLLKNADLVCGEDCNDDSDCSMSQGCKCNESAGKCVPFFMAQAKIGKEAYAQKLLKAAYDAQKLLKNADLVCGEDCNDDSDCSMSQGCKCNESAGKCVPFFLAPAKTSKA
jgi:hypothetical protein